VFVSELTAPCTLEGRTVEGSLVFWNCSDWSCGDCLELLASPDCKVLVDCGELECLIVEYEIQYLLVLQTETRQSSNVPYPTNRIIMKTDFINLILK
jgi:hypothetical protein